MTPETLGTSRLTRRILLRVSEMVGLCLLDVRKTYCTALVLVFGRGRLVKAPGGLVKENKRRRLQLVIVWLEFGGFWVRLCMWLLDYMLHICRVTFFFVIIRLSLPASSNVELDVVS
jgi:hypothetical protein